MDTEFYYFSGTGNSLAVARGLAEKTGGRLIPIASLMERERIHLAADTIGLVFPVYHKSFPLILKRFIEKTETLAGKTLFGVCTYGDTVGLAARHLDQLLRTRGGRLAAGFGVHLPYNYLTPAPVIKGFFQSFGLREIPRETQQALIAEAQQKIESMAARISAGEPGPLETTSDFITRLADRLGLEETLGKAVWLKIAGVAVDEVAGLSFLESRQWMDRGFHADEKCTGCGTCVRICPTHNITLEDRPVWHHRCEQCFACLQWCPQEALQFGSKTAGGKRYRHPGIKLADMLKQPNGS